MGGAGQRAGREGRRGAWRERGAQERGFFQGARARRRLVLGRGAPARASRPSLWPNPPIWGGRQGPCPQPPPPKKKPRTWARARARTGGPAARTPPPGVTRIAAARMLLSFLSGEGRGVTGRTSRAVPVQGRCCTGVCGCLVGNAGPRSRERERVRGQPLATGERVSERRSFRSSQFCSSRDSRASRLPHSSHDHGARHAGPVPTHLGRHQSRGRKVTL